MPASVAEVAVPLPLPGSFHYLIPDSLRGRVSVGHAVQVPFGRRRLTGYVLALCEEAPGERELRPLSSLAQPEPLFPESLVELYRWIAHYYAHPLGDVVKTALPGSTRSASKKMVRLSPGGAPPELLPSEEFAGLLDRLRSTSAPALALQSLQRRDGIPAALVSRAARRGLVEIFQQDAAAVVQPRSEERFALKVSASAARDAFPRPGPVRDRLIDWLERFGPVSRSTLKEAFPTGTAALRQLRERDVLEVTEVPVDPLAAERVTILDSDRVVPPPTEAQAAALQQLLPALEQRSFRSVLLHGVTGSGKTEVYLQLAARVLQDGGSALLLVPEIGLTPQFLARFRARFGDEVVAVLHSGLSPRERFDEWMRIRHGKARLVVGPRSAVFAPVEGLRLVVVDEEHDGSYKQETGLRYSARDLALVRCRQAGALCLLGSATPSLESIHGSIEGRLELLELPVRVQGRDLPSIELVDLREFPVDDPDSPAAALSPPLREAIEANQEDGGQAILLLNRRGFATTVLCTSCGSHFRCDDCDVSMTYHGRRHQLVCHWCGAFRRQPEACPSCSDPHGLKLAGRGTERLEEEMLALWPELRVDRMDADTTRSRAGHRKILDRFRARQVDVLVGTQMVAKGHDFPGVTLVGILHADAALHLPDFRAGERTFQLVAQVAGRAGRGERPGRVLVQTWHPEHHAIRSALEHDFGGFARRELRLRRGLSYPPYVRLAMLRVSARSERSAERASRLVRARLDAAGPQAVERRGQLRFSGPAPAPMYYLKGRYRWQLLVKAESHTMMSRLARLLDLPELHQEVTRCGQDARLVFDRDPVSML